MSGAGGCLLVFLGLLGIYFAITLSLTFYLLPLAFLFLIVSLILISFALGPTQQKERTETDIEKTNHDPKQSQGEND
jgi:uncharacterized membrane protein